MERHFIGASDVPQILGMSKYGGPVQVWARLTGRAVEEPLTPDQERGLALEPYVAEMASKELGVPLVQGTRLLHPDYEFLGATPDRYFHSDDGAGNVPATTWVHLVELKTHRERLMAAYAGGPPDAYTVQVNWQAHIARRCGWRVAPVHYLAALFGVAEFKVYEVHYKSDVMEETEAYLIRWWKEHVEGDKMPEPTAQDAGVVASLFPSETEGVLVASGTVEDLVSELFSVDGQLRELEERKAELTARIQAIMGEASVLKASAGTVTWTSANRVHKRVDFARLQEDGLYAKYVTEETKSIRYFRLKPEVNE